MQQISSRSTVLNKRIFPAFWFAIVAVIFFTFLFAHASRGRPPLVALLAPVLMAALGYFIIKNLIGDLADQVLDAGDSLIVRFGNEQEQIPLSNIINVSYAYMMNPPRVTLTLRNPGRFGSEISFSPPQRFWPLYKSPVIAELIKRVDAARQASR